MGDRGNIRIVDNFDSTESVYLYTHWGGSAVRRYAANALDRGRDRWDDAPYLARIVFCEMLKDGGDDAIMRTTGLGISTKICDNEHPIVCLDCGKQIARLEKENGPVIAEFSFEEFIAKYKE